MFVGQALTPLTIGRSPAKAGLLGSLWGFGHSTGQLILGLGLVLLKERFDALAPALTKFGGITVGGSLVFIGVTGFLEVWQDHRAAAAQKSAAGQLAVDGAPSPSLLLLASTAHAWSAFHLCALVAVCVLQSWVVYIVFAFSSNARTLGLQGVLL